MKQAWLTISNNKTIGNKQKSCTQRTSSLGSLGAATEKQELPEQDNKSTTCWNSFQQENDKQQQTASALAKELQHKACQNNSLSREGQTLGSLESETQTQQACRCPSHNNTSSLGIGTKNKAAWSILIDTGAAISLAPRSFAQHIELSPFESTLQLRSITGEVIQAFGRRTVRIACSNLSFCVSFVIANVQHAVLGMDALMANQLSLVRNIFNEYYLVNAAAATTQLHTKGQLLYIEACPREFGFSNCKGSSFQNQTGSLLNDKGRTQEEAVASSGGACDNSFSLENLREQQAKNTANLGTTTASPGKGAKRRKKKKPSAKKASQDQSQRSLEQQGQKPAATHLRSLEKTRIIDELVGAAEEEQKDSLSNIAKQNLSLRILLTLSLRNEWLITTTRATEACSQDALGEQLRNIGLGQNKVQPNIFSGDELVILLDETSILIGGTELQQECFFCELSALASLEPPKKLAQNTPISFGNLMMEYKEASYSISLRVTESFCEQLLQRHDLTQVEPTQSLQQEELREQEASEHVALNADQKELYKQTVGDLGFLASACRPDLSFEVQLLTQSLTSPTTRQALQLQKVLSYLRGTLHYSLSLHPTNKIATEEDKNLELLSFSASSWTGACQSISTACLLLWGVPLMTSCRTACAENQANAELDSVKLALQTASFTKSLLQHLALEQLATPAMISLKTSSLHMELDNGKPLAMQLGLSRRNKHLQLNGQLRLSRVLPHKNLAQSLTDNAPDETMLAKLRIDKEAAETGALSTVFGQGLASLVSSSSLLVGMVAAKPSQMEKLSPCQLGFPKSVRFVRSCPESLTRNFADSFAMSLASLTWISLSFLFDSLTLYSKSLERCNLSLQSLSQKVDRLPSLTLHSLSLATGILQSLILDSWSFAIASLILYSLSFAKDRLQRLTLQSLSLEDENGFEPMSFKEVSFDEGTEELDKSLANTKDEEES